MRAFSMIAFLFWGLGSRTFGGDFYQQFLSLVGTNECVGLLDFHEDQLFGVWLERTPQRAEPWKKASGAAFRLSFLDDKAALAETCQLLNESGCSADSVASFKKLVEHHNRKGNRVDKSRFPAPRSGFYEFHDVAD